ncbi:hypothetical protein K0M31_002372, partial [Melipona bicolor]
PIYLLFSNKNKVGTISQKRELTDEWSSTVQPSPAFTKARRLTILTWYVFVAGPKQIPKPDDGFDNRHCVSHSERVLLRCPQTRREGTIMNASAHEWLENHISKVWRYRP